MSASRDDTWSALLRVMCRDPRDPATVPIGFVLDGARRPELFALKGRHPFAIYRWVFELDDVAPGTRVRSATWAAFPGIHGKAYRALVIGTGAHRIVVRRVLRRIAASALEADYADVFEAPIPHGDSRTAEQALRDAVGRNPGAGGNVVWWIHRHVLRFHLGPYSTPDHIIGWPITRSDHDEIVLTTRGPLMRGELTLRRRDGHAALTTRLRYRHKVAARTVWAVIGPLHRAVAPRLVQRAARQRLPRMAGC
nr:DUF2867 domain-containing protein [Mycobacterium sp. 1245805.9]